MVAAFVWIIPSPTDRTPRPLANIWAIVDLPGVIPTLTEVAVIRTVTPLTAIPTAVETLIAVVGVAVMIATGIIMVVTVGIGEIAGVQLLLVVDVIPQTTEGEEVILGALLEAVALLAVAEIMMHLLRLVAPLQRRQMRLTPPDGEVVDCFPCRFPSLRLPSLGFVSAKKGKKGLKDFSSDEEFVQTRGRGLKPQFSSLPKLSLKFRIRIPVDSTQNPSCQVSCPFFCYLACIRRRFLQLSLLFASARINSSLDIHGRFTCQ